MKLLLKPILAAGIAMAALSTVPASAQVSGNVAVVNAPEVVLRASALQAAYQQIDVNYAQQRTLVQQKSQQRADLIKQLDTNNDGQFSEAEEKAAATAPQIPQIQTLDEEIGDLQNQIEGARVYAIEQILLQYVNVLQTFVQQNKVQMVLSPDSVVFAQPAAQITDKIVTALNTAAPTVNTTPPADWQPSRQAVAMYQQVQQAVMAAQAQRAQQQQAAQQPAQPQPAPVGR